MSMDAGPEARAVREFEAPPRHWSELSLDGLRATAAGSPTRRSASPTGADSCTPRIDVLEAEAHHERPCTWTSSIRVLGDTGSGRGRNALVSVHAADPLPDLPILQEMWVTELDPNDAEAVADALRRLRVAEKQLTDYRSALHGRLDEATKELIGRYRRTRRASGRAGTTAHAHRGNVMAQRRAGLRAPAVEGVPADRGRRAAQPPGHPVRPAGQVRRRPHAHPAARHRSTRTTWSPTACSA